MELIVFDLDGTLLNRDSQISEFTRETLRLLAQRGIAYTVATGRALHGAQDILAGHNFTLPQIFKNGAMIWLPERETYTRKYVLSEREIERVLAAFLAQEVAPLYIRWNRTTAMRYTTCPLAVMWKKSGSMNSKGEACPPRCCLNYPIGRRLPISAPWVRAALLRR